MALPAHLAERFSPALVRALRGGFKDSEAGSGFSLGPLDSVLPDAGLLRGGVVELSLSPGVPGTSLVLDACRAIQVSAERMGGAIPWCAFVDPSQTLHAPGVKAAGVRLDRLLVVRPPLKALERTVFCLAKSAAFELVIVDLVGVRGAGMRLSLDPWPRLVRRLALEVDGTRRSVVLLTDAAAHRALPLPVAQRIEVERPLLERLVARVAKDRRGMVTPQRPITWTRPWHEGAVEGLHANTG